MKCVAKVALQKMKKCRPVQSVRKVGRVKSQAPPRAKLVKEVHIPPGLENKGVRIVPLGSARQPLRLQSVVNVQKAKLLAVHKARRALCVRQVTLHPKHPWLNAKSVLLVTSTNYQSTPSAWRVLLVWHVQQQVHWLSPVLQGISVLKIKASPAKNVQRAVLNHLIA